MKNTRIILTENKASYKGAMSAAQKMVTKLVDSRKASAKR